MSERVQLPGKGALGLDMPGTKYNTRRDLGEGVVEVSDADAALIRAHTGLQVGQRFSAPTAQGVTCSKCGFQQFKVMAGSTCNRCGGDWVAEDIADNINTSPIPTVGRVKVYDI